MGKERIHKFKDDVADSEFDYSIVIPVYLNRSTLPALVDAMEGLASRLPGHFEVVFVVDGSPDDSITYLCERLPSSPLEAQLILHSRNFGSFAAIRTGLSHARGSYMASMSADLQEPPELMLDFFEALSADDADVILGAREDRSDPWLTRLYAGIFWTSYRRFVQRDMPPGGLDVFACNRAFCRSLLELTESNSSLVGQVLWLGFRRKTIAYRRQARLSGKSAWGFRRKVRYLLDSMFSFTDLPITGLFVLGGLGLTLALALVLLTTWARLTGQFDVPGYTATVFTISFFAGLNLIGLGIVGSYVWRTFENTKSRPLSIVSRQWQFTGNGEAPRPREEGVPV